MTGTEFVRQFARTGLPSWEAAAIALAREDAEGRTGGATGKPPNLTPWPWVDLHLSAARPTGGQDTATLRVMSDVLSIGPFSDHVRLPLTPRSAQSICNLFGWLLPTPWLVYQMWRASPYKLAPISLPNKGADLYQYADHSALIDRAIDEAIAPGELVADRPAGSHAGAVGGIKKSVVVSNIYQPGKVVIFGWYQPSPPHPDVFSNGLPMRDPNRQPWQPKSNVHSEGFVDYSHGIQPVWWFSVVNGERVPTETLYTHPTLSRLVSNESPSALRVARYPASIAPAAPMPATAVSALSRQPNTFNVISRFVPTYPPVTTAYLQEYLRKQVRG